jgi:hypothetical protein
MSSNFAVVGAGSIGSWIVDELLKYKSSGVVNTLKVISRSVSPYLPITLAYKLSVVQLFH